MSFILTLINKNNYKVKYNKLLNLDLTYDYDNNIYIYKNLSVNNIDFDEQLYSLIKKKHLEFHNFYIFDRTLLYEILLYIQLLSFNNDLEEQFIELTKNTAATSNICPICSENIHCEIFNFCTLLFKIMVNNLQRFSKYRDEILKKIRFVKEISFKYYLKLEDEINIIYTAKKKGDLFLLDNYFFSTDPEYPKIVYEYIFGNTYYLIKKTKLIKKDFNFNKKNISKFY